MPQQLLTGVLVLLLTQAGEAQGSEIEPANEDAELVRTLLEGRVDVEPERVVHVAPLPGPDGDGTATSPRRDLISVVDEAVAGTAIHLAPGVYDMSAVRDAFSHASSRLMTRRDGEPGRPIVVRTDPEVHAAGGVATLDFSYENTGDWSSAAFVARNDEWVFERFEMRRMRKRGFAVNGSRVTLRELHLHHANTDGTGNDALIVMLTSSVRSENVIAYNHLHDVGIINTETDALLRIEGVNSGCHYSVTRLTYDSDAPAAGNDASRAEWEAALLPPDSHVYVVGNHAHHCHYGLGLKNPSRGPYYFLSNIVHDTAFGIYSPFRETIVRNNVLYDNRLAGVRLGNAQSSGPSMTFFKFTNNGAHSDVSHNTIVGSQVGVTLQNGWGTRIEANLIVDVEEPLSARANRVAWWEANAWPGVRGEYLIGDMSPEHPFWDLVPGYVRESADDFTRTHIDGNCYEVAPAFAAAERRQSAGEIAGQIFDDTYTLVSAGERDALFVDEANGDYRLAAAGACGSRIGLGSTAEPGPDGGVSDGGVADSEAGPGDGGVADGGSRDAASGTPDAGPSDGPLDIGSRDVGAGPTDAGLVDAAPLDPGATPGSCASHPGERGGATVLLLLMFVGLRRSIRGGR